MNSRERVLAALARKEPDKVPIDCGGTICSTLTRTAHNSVKAYLDIRVPDEPVTHPVLDTVVPCEELLGRWQVDFRTVRMKSPGAIDDASADRQGFAATSAAVVIQPHGHEFSDEFGNVWRKADFDYAPVKHAFADFTLDDLKKFRWPDPYDLGRVAGLEEEARRLKDTTEYAVVGDIMCGGPFEQALWLRGYEQFLTDLYLDPKFARTLLDMITELDIGFWLRVFPGKRVLDGQWIEPTEAQVKALAENKEQIQKIRKRLSSISWFMSAPSEYIARRRNQEDRCTGRFWEGRFSCREIGDESALLVCGMYVDLNPIRAGEVRTPETACHSSASFRIRARQDAQRRKKAGERVADDWLAPLTLEASDLGDVPSTSGHRASDKGLLSMSLDEYLRLLDWCGREVRGDKPGAIPADLAPIVERLGIVPGELVATVRDFPQRFRRLAGSVQQFRKRATELGRRCLQGIGTAARVFR